MPDWARFLTGRGFSVVEVNRPDRSVRRHKGKSDPTDAEMAARAVLAGVADATPKSGEVEVEMLQFLYEAGIRLPDLAQNRPSREVNFQPDFYYERENLPGVCVFVDGPHHDAPKQQDEDARLRTQLQDRGFRVIAVRYDKPFFDQVQRHPDVFAIEG